MRDWLARAKAAAASPAPDAAKAAEWLLDNDYHVQRAIRQIEQDLPPRLYRRLPSLNDPEDDGLPRVLAIAHGLLDASQMQLSLTSAVRFVQAYQEDATFTCAELRALPTMLRIACLEVMIRGWARLFSEVRAPFAPTRYAAAYDTLDATKCVSRALANLISISSISWKDFYDRTSLVETILRDDPAGFYPCSDFETRDRYRTAVEELALRTGQPETDVARRAIALARQAKRGSERNHVGYWLVGDGSDMFDSPAGVLSVHAWGRMVLRRPGLLYGLALITFAAVTLSVPTLYLAKTGADPGGWLLGLALTILPASAVSIAMSRLTVALVVPPRVLPKLDFSKGIPPDCATALVVPVVVASADEVQGLVDCLELHRLANPNPSLRFVLLSNHTDAPAERMPGDDQTERALVMGIRQLNDRYGQDGERPFHLLHRPRRFNPSDRSRGWDRKQGKIEELNRILLNNDAGEFSLREGDQAQLGRIRFVVTVDADTILPQGSISRLVGTLAHPMNTARFDDRTGRITAGYTVLQPRIELAPDNGSNSLFAHLYAGDAAIDIYSRSVSDVYQDLTGSGIYVAKGIHEVAAFQRSPEGRVPENALVSHDLFDGIHARVGLAGDIVLYENFPTSYLEYVRHWHSRVRGDWQLLSWLARKVRGAGECRPWSRLTVLDRWKVLDCLRSSLVPASLLALAAAGWLGLPGDPWVWTALTIAPPGACLFADFMANRVRNRRRGIGRMPFREIGGYAGRWLVAIVFLAHDAVVALDAVVRTLWRPYAPHRNLLDRTLAGRAPKAYNTRNARAEAWRAMWPSSMLAMITASAVATVNFSALASAAPLLLLWLCAPEIAAWLSRPYAERMEEFGSDDRIFLRRLARRTWLYFETFAGPAANWLPPDNVQEGTEIAHRTSPTNIGMMFLSQLGAWDLGYSGSRDLAARIRNSLNTLDRLDRFRGHFLNWYDTRLLRPLEPRYVSTVDSGNLAVCFMALRKGCQEAADSPALRPEQWDGLADTLGVLGEAIARLPGGGGKEVQTLLEATLERIASDRNDISAMPSVLAVISGQTFPELQAAVARTVGQSEQASAEILQDIRIWLERVHHHLVGMERDLEALLPWLPLLEMPPPGCRSLALEIAGLAAVSVPLTRIEECYERARAALANAGSTQRDAVAQWFVSVDEAIKQGVRKQVSLREDLLGLAQRAEALAMDMDFRSLLDPERLLFSVGYNVTGERLDSSHYDLLASEARLASFFAIAKGDAPFEHWQVLGRPMTRTAGGPCLVSWGGSMFEYLMPALFLRSGPWTLLGQSERSAVDAQRHYAKRHEVPWGMSESAYAQRNADRHYRYRSFGVPALGLRRGLSLDLVVAPYASVLALAVRPAVAVANLRELQRMGLVGQYGFLEAADFTPERIPVGVRFLPVHAFMAHHQGMIVAALDNALHDDVLVRRFRADPRLRAVELLAQERVLWEIRPDIREIEDGKALPARQPPVPALHPWTPQSAEICPQLQALGNGHLASWISEAGGGGLNWQGQSLTRWAPDPTRDHYGLWIYVRDEDHGSVWSIGRQPTGVEPDEAHTVFHPHMVEFHRRDHDIGVRMEVGVIPGDDVEFRRITVVNEGKRPRRLRITSYGEVVLADRREDERHPVFSKLFVGSEYMPGMNGLLFMRTPRRVEEKHPLLLHRVLIEESGLELAGFETDRRAFLGRNGDVRHPRALREGFSGTVGWTLDPVMALDVAVDIEPYGRRQLAFLTVAARTRESLLAAAERYATFASLDWGLSNAASDVAREAQRLGLLSEHLPDLQRLASLLVYRHPALRADPEVLAGNRLGQPRLWAHGISGDHPILLIHVRDTNEIDFLRMLVAGHLFWRRRGIEIDLVVLRGGASGYGEPFSERFAALLDELGAEQHAGRGGRIHLISADQIHEEERGLIQAAAQVVLDASKGSLARQLASVEEARLQPPRLVPLEVRPPGEEPAMPPRAAGLLFENGFGGFSADGGEYVIHLEQGETTPAPWCNVLANGRFGTITTEAGGGFTWSLNSGENRLTPCTNDPVADPHGEVLYLRDEETVEIWTPTPKPAGEGAAYEIRHGAGHTVWRHVRGGIEHELLVFVPVDDPVKVIRLRLRNLTSRTRRITATYYADWLLGALWSMARPFVVCEYDPACHALLARNPWNPDFAERMAFLTSNLPPHSLTCDRRDFVGRDGSLAAPAGLKRWDLGGRVGPGGDACAAFQVHLEIDAGEDTDVVFVLGQGDDRAHAQALARRWQDPSRAENAFEELHRHWNRRLGAVSVKTPDPAFDLMVNRWLPYQTLASRILARAGFYQAGGAIGFRDQLQDVLALLHAEPDRARTHILAAAARQFEEGDVLHWWHPPNNLGVRTRCSDDLLWLPYVTGCYVEATGDESILREKVPFLSAQPLGPGEEDRYARFDAGSTRTLFEHCERALERGVTRGVHELPLIGSGDWNDGMNRIGRAGRGESVWLGWFAIAVLKRFADLCRRMEHDDLAERWLRRARQLQRAIDKTAWDGRWYLRAFDDEGRPIGSNNADECRIDSIAQSWAVLAGDNISQRTKTALESAARELVREDERLVRLLWPPFKATPSDPGYIKAYPPGIRENGGQYSHAAAWLGHAFAKLGDGERAWQIFDLLNPIRRSSTRAEAEHYRVEPYVVAADIAGVAPHTGQGGWTWYTGSAAWTWRLGVEAILGLRLQDGRLLIDPCLPMDWGFFEARIRGANGTLAIRVDDPDKIGSGHVEMTVDGIRAVGATVGFPTDGSTRRVEVRLRRATSRTAGP